MSQRDGPVGERKPKFNLESTTSLSAGQHLHPSAPTVRWRTEWTNYLECAAQQLKLECLIIMRKEPTPEESSDPVIQIPGSLFSFSLSLVLRTLLSLFLTVTCDFAVVFKQLCIPI